MIRIYKFFFFFLKYPLRYKLELLKLYFNTAAKRVKTLQYQGISSEFIKINHKLHEFSNSKSFDFEILKGEILLSDSYNHKKLKLYVKDYSSDLFIYDRIFVEKEYEIVPKLLKSRKIKPKMMLDCGCNIASTPIFMNMYFDNLRYICIEPDSSNIEQAHKNLQINNITNYKLYHKGIWSSKQMRYINRNAVDGLNRDYYLVDTITDTPIETISIADIIFENEIDIIDFLKLDIEGIEEELFKNTPESDYRWLDQVRILSINIHDELECRENILKVLSDRHFEIKQEGELTLGINKKLCPSFILNQENHFINH